MRIVTSISFLALVHCIPFAAAAQTSTGQSTTPAQSTAPAQPAAAGGTPVQCTQAVSAGIVLGGGLDTKSVCTGIVNAIANRRTAGQAPASWIYTTEGPDFPAVFARSLKLHGRERRGVRVRVDMSPPPTEENLRSATSVKPTQAELGAWLDAIDRHHDGVYRKTDLEAVSLAPLAFEWVVRPLISFIANLFPKNPYAAAKGLDAVVVTYGAEGPNRGAIRLICFVKRGTAGAKDSCPI